MTHTHTKNDTHTHKRIRGLKKKRPSRLCPSVMLMAQYLTVDKVLSLLFILSLEQTWKTSKVGISITPYSAEGKLRPRRSGRTGRGWLRRLQGSPTSRQCLPLSGPHLHIWRVQVLARMLSQVPCLSFISCGPPMPPGFCEAHLSMWGKSPSLWFLPLSSPSLPVLPSCFSLDWSLCYVICRCSFGVSGGGRGASSRLSWLLGFRAVSLWGRGVKARPSPGGGLGAW